MKHVILFRKENTLTREPSPLLMRVCNRQKLSMDATGRQGVDGRLCKVPLWFAKLSMMQPGDAVARPTQGGEIELPDVYAIGGQTRDRAADLAAPIAARRTSKVRAILRAHPVRTVSIITIVPSIITVVVCVSALPSHSPPSLSPSSPPQSPSPQPSPPPLSPGQLAPPSGPPAPPSVWSVLRGG